MCTGAYVHVEYPVLVKTQTVKGERKQKINRKEEKERERKKIPCAKAFKLLQFCIKNCE